MGVDGPRTGVDTPTVVVYWLHLSLYNRISLHLSLASGESAISAMTEMVDLISNGCVCV